MKNNNNKHSIYYLIVLIIFGVFTSCSPFFPEEFETSIYDNFYEIKIINNYDAPVVVNVDYSDAVEIEPFSSHVFLIESSYEKDYLYVRADGKYFSYYSEFVDIEKNFKNIHTLEADQGWYGLKNLTEDRLDSPDYNYGPFWYKDDFESYSSSYDLDTGDIGYVKVDERSDLDGEISFYLNGGYTKYKLNEISDYPELGKTKIIEVYSSNIVSYYSRGM